MTVPTNGQNPHAGADRPLIGITIGPERDDSDYLRLRGTYARAILAAGGLPLLVPPMEPAALAAVLQHLDGMLFPGGADVDPAHYHQARQPRTEVNARLDDLELAAARWVAHSDLPTLGICRGQQLLNVALGGSLVQHLETHPRSEQAHRTEQAHALKVAPASRLASILGATELHVNSLHHQAVAALAPSLHAVAWAPDGTIEALESNDHPWLMAVQFHPEDLVGNHEPSRRLFSALVAAARARRAAAFRSPVAGLR